MKVAILLLTKKKMKIQDFAPLFKPALFFLATLGQQKQVVSTDMTFL